MGKVIAISCLKALKIAPHIFGTHTLVCHDAIHCAKTDFLPKKSFLCQLVNKQLTLKIINITKNEWLAF